MPKRNKSKYVTRREFPRLLMSHAETKFRTLQDDEVALHQLLPIDLDMTAIDQGDGTNERVGNEIQIQSLFFRCTFSNTLGDTTTDKAYYAIATLFSPRDPTELPPDTLPMQFFDKERYVIWAQKVVPIPWTNNISGGMITIKKRWSPYMKAVYDNGQAAFCLKNKLFIQISTDCHTDSLVDVSYQCRLYYKDV